MDKGEMYGSMKVHTKTDTNRRWRSEWILLERAECERFLALMAKCFVVYETRLINTL
jgi:hypothetical protein